MKRTPSRLRPRRSGESSTRARCFKLPRLSATKAAKSLRVTLGGWDESRPAVLVSRRIIILAPRSRPHWPGGMRMSARSSARFVGLLFAIGAAPAAGAAEFGQPSAPAPDITPAISLPMFLDSARLPDLQAAWRTRFGGDIAVAAPVAAPSSDPEAGTISEARQTLTRAEQVTIEAAAVRERAEELSRRFAVGAPGEAPASEPAIAQDASTGAPVTETASIGSDAVPGEASPAGIQQVSVSTDAAPASDMTPASMLGGPKVEKGAADDAAPVIEDMAKPQAQPVAKRVPVNPPAPRAVQSAAASEPPTLFGIFSSWGSSEEEPAPKSHETENDPMMPTEIRSFGWNAQPR